MSYKKYPYLGDGLNASQIYSSQFPLLLTFFRIVILIILATTI
jgi:hypothetical protein